MNRRLVVVGLVGVTGVFLILANSGVNSTGPQAGVTEVTLPASLDQFYPPKSPAPTYLQAMVGMARLFSGIACDALENDLENGRLTFELFRKAYIENSMMIPEWKEKYPMAPVEQLGAAITTGDASKIMLAVESVGAVCHNCHLQLMTPVQHKYRWHNFADISLTDPLSGEDVSYARFMLMIATNFDGIGIDVEQGQHENAIKQFAGFNARFQAMADACMICHDSERQYYVGESITDKIADLQNELSKPEIDGARVGGLLQTIGQESCLKCHQVHIPAAYAQQVMKSR